MKLIFTLTAGRTGTAYLAELLRRNEPNAEVHHEIIGFQSFGVDTPDISHLHTFNNFGNTKAIQEFWQRKFDKILNCGKRCYVETSHVLMKAGLIENIVKLAGDHEVHFVRLTRNISQTISSYHRRRDLATYDNMWMWYLDPDYMKSFVKPAPFMPFGIQGIRLWYIFEVAVRASYYQKCYTAMPHLRFHTADIDNLNDNYNIAKLFTCLDLSIDNIVIPPKQNVGINKILQNKEKTFIDNLIKKFPFDPEKMAQKIIE